MSLESSSSKIVAQFDDLIHRVNQCLAPTGLLRGRYDQSPDIALLTELATSATNLIERVCGKNSPHAQQMITWSGKVTAEMHRGAELLGTLRAAREDFVRGMLFDIRHLIEAEVFADFTGQAESLIAAGYHVPAASLMGAVLEDALRKLCDKAEISYPDKTGIDRLNADLAKASIYDKLVQKRITHLADIRNKADHGKFSEFKRDDVEDMIRWTSRFLADYLS